MGIENDSEDKIQKNNPLKECPLTKKELQWLEIFPNKFQEKIKEIISSHVSSTKSPYIHWSKKAKERFKERVFDKYVDSAW